MIQVLDRVYVLSQPSQDRAVKPVTPKIVVSLSKTSANSVEEHALLLHPMTYLLPTSNTIIKLLLLNED